MFGGTKLVPKVTSTQSSNKGKSLGQHAAGRMAFTNKQINVLEEAFHHSQYPDSHLKMSLAQQLDHPVSRVQVKFLKSFKEIGPGRPSAGGPRMDRRGGTSPGFVKNASLCTCKAQLGGDLIQQQC